MDRYAEGMIAWDAVEALLAEEPCARAGLYESVEIHDWRFGGRPSA